MKTFLATDSVRLNDTFEKKTEMVEIVRGSGFVREGDEFRSYSQFQTAYGGMAGVRLDDRQKVENYLARIGLCFVENGDKKVITKVGDEVGNMLYDFYLSHDEPTISRMTNIWQGENREKINKFLRDGPWNGVEDRLRFRDYGFSQGVASAIFVAKPETKLFEIEEADFEINLPEGSLWKIDRIFKVVGMTNPKRADISCVCGKQMKMYQVQDLESGVCLSCQSCTRRTTDFVAFYQSISNEGYVVIKDFEESRPTNRSRILLQCLNPSHQPYLTDQKRWMNLGARCPSCSAFHVGEQKTREFLQSRGVSFKEQVRSNDLIGLGGRKLSYDFQIELNGESILLEIDGAQHFSPQSFGSRDDDISEQAYQRQVENDQLKDLYAAQNDLRLVRIQNIDSNYDFIIESLESILSGSDINYYGSLYQKKD